MAVPRCNYSYDKLEEAMMGMLVCFVKEEGYTSERVINSYSDFQMLMNLLKTEKGVAKVLIAEGRKMLAKGKELSNNE